MKIAAFSDSHGYVRIMEDAVREYEPDLIVHLGDYARDVNAIKKEFPRIPVKAVRGNCDMWTLEPERETFFADGIKILLTHGHREGVKSGTEVLAGKAREQGAELALYGHTHAACYDDIGGVILFNPGAAGDLGRASFGLIVIDAGIVKCSIIHL